MGRITLGVMAGCVIVAAACDPSAGAPADNDAESAGHGGTYGGASGASGGGGDERGGGSAGERTPNPDAKVADPATDCVAMPLPPPEIPDAGAGTTGPDSMLDASLMHAPTEGADDDAGIGTATPDDELPGNTPPGTPPGPRAPNRHGDLVITEIMMNPTPARTAIDEWIELYNASDVDLDLGDCIVHDDNRDRFTIATFVARRGARVVLGRTPEAATQVDILYSGMFLANTDDVVTITCDGVMIDRVAYGPGYPRPAGRTMQLDPNAHTAVDNDAAGAWCAGPTGGTPGLPNVACGGT